MDAASSNDVQQKLKGMESELQLLKLANQQLMEENQVLSMQMEAVLQENTTKLEALEQDRYSLNIRLNQQLKMATCYQDEIDCLRSQITSERESIIEQANAEHSGKITLLQKQINRLRSDVEISQAAEDEKALRIKQLEDIVHQLQGECESRIAPPDNVMLGDENERLSTELSSLRTLKVNLTQECDHLRNIVEQHKSKIDSLGSQLRNKEQEAEENECRATSYYNALEKTRVEVQELKMELELAKMEANTTKNKGNSLFSEVEDRRVAAEKQLITVQVQNNSLKRQLDISRQNLHLLKMQVAALLQMSGSKADARHMESVTQQLSQATGDIQLLTSQLHASQKETKSLQNQLMRLTSNAEGDAANYIQYLQALLARKEAEVATLQQDLQTKRLVMLAETEKLTECERRLYESEQQLTNIRSQNVRLQLRLDELRLKIEPSTVVSGTVRKVKVEKIPLHAFPAAATAGAIGPELNYNSTFDCKPVDSTTNVDGVETQTHTPSEARSIGGEDQNLVCKPGVKEPINHATDAARANMENQKHTLKENDNLSNIPRNVALDQCVVGLEGGAVVEIFPERSCDEVISSDKTRMKVTADLDNTDGVKDIAGVNRRQRVKVVNVPIASEFKDDQSCKTQ